MRLLKPSGLLIATSPNVSHWRVIAALLRGRFDYCEMGVMDRTHFAGPLRRPSARCSSMPDLLSNASNRQVASANWPTP